MFRREMLKGLGLTAAAAATAGCESLIPDSGENKPQAGSAPYTDQFETVIDLTSVGADPAGNSSIVSLLNEHLGSDTLVYLPQGEYLMDDTVDFHEFKHAGLVGNGATIVPEDGYDSVLFDIGRPGKASDFLLEDIQFDLRAPQTGARVVSLLVGGESAVRDLEVIGTLDAGWGGIRMDTTDPDGVCTVERLNLPDGSTPSVRVAGCYVGDHHRGEIRFNNCRIEGFADNGLYADTPRGAVRVNGGYFANCDVSCLRVGSDSKVNGAHVRCNTAPDGFGNMRGLRIREGQNISVENCTIEMRDVTYSGGAIVFAHWLKGATVRNTHVQVNADNVEAIRIRDPDVPVDANQNIQMQNITIDGAAGGGPTVEVNEREGCQFDNIWIYQSGDNRDGFVFNNCSATVANSYVNVTGTAFRSNSQSDIVQQSVDIPTGSDNEKPKPPQVVERSVKTETGLTEILPPWL